MKLIATVFFVLLCGGTIYGSRVGSIEKLKPVVAQMNSMIEGQMKYEVALGSHVKKWQLVEEVDSTAYHANVLTDMAKIDLCRELYNESSAQLNAHIQEVESAMVILL